MSLRASEWVAVVFFGYMAALSLVLPVSQSVTAVILGVNCAVFAGFAVLAYVDRFRRGEFLGIVRDWYLPPLLLLAYREVGWLALPERRRGLEQAWVVWDKWLLNDLGVRSAIEVLGPLLPSVLEISYSLVYAMTPFGMAVLYAYHKRERVNAFLFQVLLSVLTVYVLLPFFPSEPPWTVFPGEDFPTYATVFRRFNGGLLHRQGIHTGVFPSAHVAGSFGVALALVRLLPERRWVGRFTIVLATLIAVATVYGRYHYAVDALAGLAVAFAAAAISARSAVRAAGPAASAAGSRPGGPGSAGSG